MSAYWEARTIGNASYVFSGDMNGDSASGNDLIYIHRDQSEMNFSAFTASGRTFTAAEQAAAWDAYIAQDSYLSKHRGEYAERGAVFLPLVKRMDFSVSQDIFQVVRRRAALGPDPPRHRQLRQPAELELGREPAPGAEPDPDQRRPPTRRAGATYRMAVVNSALPTTTYQSTSGIADVYTLMLSFRYNFN